MLEVYRHGARHGGTFGGHHHSSAIQPHRGVGSGGGFGGLGDWTDALLPRSSSSSPTSAFNVWELSPNKLRTAAVAFTFVVTAGYISLLAAGGLLAILVTGAVVTCCVLLTVLTCATLITLIVTGVPVGYAIIRMIMAARSSGGANNKPQAYGAAAGGSSRSGIFAGLFGGHGRQQQQQQQQHGDEEEAEDRHQSSPGVGVCNGFGGGRAYGTVGGAAASGWRFRAEGDEDSDAE
ncbi:hypothetical protein Vretimale_18504 [Volvox reticuliferus]|uniref:Uncharacterized protein n=1 Tax=Volvox reticuliferus TaxID=1737510 RepID=A0A8J4D4Y2_9CHLO|nr:hypothetical protein Vretifemale_19658 [Volvox reticuliferus]GIM15837.1 hypothetical protein Vretimale_18504 [Volvox reticuliferus]